MPDGSTNTKTDALIHAAATQIGKRPGQGYVAAKGVIAAKLGCSIAEMERRASSGTSEERAAIEAAVNEVLSDAPVAGAPRSRLEWALAHAARGFRVFPVAANEKRPRAGVRWKEWATSDAATIRDHWSANPNDNIGISAVAFGDGAKCLCCIDIDVKNGKDGEATFAKLVSEGAQFPDTCQQHTPSNGRHLIYWAKEWAAQGTDKLGTGVDVKSGPGYVLGAGSVINGVAYTIDDTPIAELPDAIASLIGRVIEPKPAKNGGMPVSAKREAPAHDRKADRKADPRIDQVCARARAVEWCKDADPAVTGSGGDPRTIVVANFIGDFGLDAPQTLEVMREHFNPRCLPPWFPAELELKVFSAFNSRQKEIGCSTAEMEFPPVELGTTPEQTSAAVSTTQVPSRRFVAKLAGDALPDLDRVWLVDNLIPANGFAPMRLDFTVKVITSFRRWHSLLTASRLSFADTGLIASMAFIVVILWMGTLPKAGKIWSSSERRESNAWSSGTLVFLISSHWASTWSRVLLMLAAFSRV